MAATLISNIKTLWQTDDGTRVVLRGKAMATIPHLNNAWLLIENGLIADFGTMDTIPEMNCTQIDASGKMVLPAWVDSHTHLVFAGNRAEEFAMRIKGKTYEDIAAAGGGIIKSAAKMRGMDESELFDKAQERLEHLIQLGTGTIEIKSGYGLSTAAELKMLRVIRKLKEKNQIEIKATFLGAHAIPTEYKNNRSGYIDLIIDEMLPKIADEQLANYCDVFCEEGYFTNEETDRILAAASEFDIKPKIHVNQFTNTGGIQTGIKNNAISVDHLEHLGEAEINALLQSNTLPVALPGCSFFIQIPYTPGRKLIDAGLPIVLASDFNPGSCPSGNMAFVVALACIQMKLTPEEAINAATLNGAAALELSNKVGSIAKGKQARLIITKPIESLAEIPYRFGANLIDRVII
ncbi:MAG: imidazolonepropionase [Bacteroidetes bacterium]|nr:imidazolonepropionase [Bacteroidota bacterium]